MLIDTPTETGLTNIFEDGPRRDTLIATLADDVFVLQRDGKTDTVRDFTPGQDLIDLSDFHVGFDQVQIKQIAPGEFVFTIREERTKIIFDQPEGDPDTYLDITPDIDNFIFKDNLAEAPLQVHLDTDGVDRLFGTPSPDVFVLTPDGVRDAVRLFELGKDQIDLAGYNTSFGEISFIDRKPGRVVINVPNGDGVEAVVVHDGSKLFTAQQFTEDDFIF